MDKKIPLTAEQLRALYAQLLSALQEHVPPGTPPSVQMHLQDYLLRVLDASLPSLDVVNADQTTSTTLLSHTQQRYVGPLDTSLNENVRQTYQEWEDLTVKVAQLRREGPGRVNALYSQDARDLLNSIDARISETPGQDAGDAGDAGDTTGIPDTLPTLDTYTAVLAQLHDAKEQLPETRAALRRLAATLQRTEAET